MKEACEGEGEAAGGWEKIGGGEAGGEKGEEEGYGGERRIEGE